MRCHRHRAWRHHLCQYRQLASCRPKPAPTACRGQKAKPANPQPGQSVGAALEAYFKGEIREVDDGEDTDENGKPISKPEPFLKFKRRKTQEQ